MFVFSIVSQPIILMPAKLTTVLAIKGASGSRKNDPQFIFFAFPGRKPKILELPVPKID